MLCRLNLSLLSCPYIISEHNEVLKYKKILLYVEDTRIFLVNKLKPAHMLTVQWPFHNVSQPYEYTYIFIRNVFSHLYSNLI